MLNEFFLYLLISNVAKQLHVSIHIVLCFSNLHSQSRWNTSCVCSAGIPAVSKLYIRSQSNAMLCHFQIISVLSWTFALIFCAWISVCRWIEKSKIAFSAVAVESIDWNYYFAHRYCFWCLEVDHWQPAATRHFNAQQSCCCSSCLLLPLSSRADLI